MLKEKIFSFIGKIRSFMRVEACALVSRDMIISGKYLTGNSMSQGLALSWQQSLHPLSLSEGLVP
jgi:hypothetical protein